jgi:secondary thiamine-phosphate synthase enzyme
MKIANKTFNISTDNHSQMLDITGQVRSVVSDSKIKDGVAIVYCPHTTAGITINENADPSVMHDILLTLDELIPRNRRGYRHGEGNSDAHTKSSLVGCSERILISDGSLNLGTWQGIFFCEFDGPRSRRFTVQVSGE